MPPASASEPRRGRLFLMALVLAALAGWVDAVGFLRLGGLFVSFMSGDTTQLGLAVHTGLAVHGLRPGLAVLAFVTGVVLGEVLGTRTGSRRRTAVLCAEAGLLGVAALVGRTSGSDDVVLVLLGLAMGMQNAAIHRADRIGVALTYVTGTLVHFGRAAAAALLGRGSWAQAAPFGALWASLGVGAAFGGAVAARSEQGALATAALVAAALGAAALALERDPAPALTR